MKEAKVSSKQGWTGVDKKDKHVFTKDFATNVALKALNAREKVMIGSPGAAEESPGEGKDEGGEEGGDGEEEGTLITGSNMKGEEELKATGNKMVAPDVPTSAHRRDSSGEDGVMAAPIKGYKDKVKLYDNELFKEKRQEPDSIKFILWDYGGQRIFYSLHHLFLSKLGIYVLIFNMSQMLHQPGLCKVYLQFWLNSLSLHAPETALFMVGTFRDEAGSEGDMATIGERVNEILRTYPFNVAQNEVDNLPFFPISNKLGLGVSVFRDALNKTARAQPHVKMEVPMSWIYTIENLLTKQRKPWISMVDLKRVAAKYKVKTEEEVREMVKLFHDLGLVLHLTQTSVLQDLVTLRPQWLVRSLGRIIRDGNIHKHNQEYIKEEGLEQDVEYLFKDGLVSDRFLQLIWNNNQVDYLLDLMKQTLILSNWTFKGSSVNSITDENGNKRNFYFIPSLVTGSKDLESYDDEVEQQNDTEEPRAGQVAFLESKADNVKNICVFEFGFLPDGIYDRLICLCVAHSNLLKVEKPPVISAECSEISFANGSSVKLYEKKEVETLYLELAGNQESVERAQSSLAIVSAMLTKLQKDIIGNGLSWKVWFPKDTKELISYEDAIQSNLTPWFANVSRTEYEEKTSVAEHIDVEKFLNGLQDL